MRQILKIVLPLIGRKGLIKYIALGILSGLFSFLFVNIVTRVLDLIISGKYQSISNDYFFVFIIIILMFVWTKKVLSMAIIRISQQIFWKLRMGILSLVLKTSYQQMSGQKVKIYTALVNDIDILTNASLRIVDFFTALILSITCLIYLASISPVLFLITLAVAFLGVIVYYSNFKRNAQEFHDARELENKFLGHFNSILDGFKEIYMDPEKGKYIFENKIKLVANDSIRNNTTAFKGLMHNQMTGQILFGILISSVLLYFSVILKIAPGDTVRFIFTLLYLSGSIEIVMVLLPGLVKAKVSSDHLVGLKEELENSHFSEEELEVSGFPGGEFTDIKIKDLEFSYKDSEKNLGIGPVNMHIKRGDVIFIYGGNGSGKTTFVYVVLGLFKPNKGEIKINGISVNSDNLISYRSAFSVVFSDFYLFSELFTDKFDKERLNFYLRLFELEGKVTIDNRSFSSTDLSTGQRKRLALISVLLENRPLLVLDEWAADQDPYFRKKFYTEIIPLLKKKGITIIAITHDDKYYHCADKLFKMDYGKLIDEKQNMPELNLLPDRL